MSPASKSKSKPSGKASKEQQKAPIKPSGSANAGNGVLASAYNPISGTFHTLDMEGSFFSAWHSSSRVYGGWLLLITLPYFLWAYLNLIIIERNLVSDFDLLFLIWLIQVNDLESARRAGKQFGYPLMVKSKSLAYDGRGNVVAKSEEELSSAITGKCSFKDNCLNLI